MLERKPKYFKDTIRWIVNQAKRFTLPGFEGVPIFDVMVFFFRGIQQGALTTRASAIAFNFFLAIFPAIIFFFSLIPYVPIDNFQTELLSLLSDIVPNNAYEMIEGTLQDLVHKQRGGLLSVGIVTALIFSTNGINAMIVAFNASHHTRETRSWIAQRLISLVLVFILSILLTTAIGLVIFSQTVIRYLVELEILKVNFTFYLISGGKWVVILALFFFALSFLYYFAPAKKKRWKFISAGSTLATFLSIVISIAFSEYVNNFGQYNKIYGSIGTLIVILIWMYFNSLVLLIGFELNASLKNAHLEMFPDENIFI